jgi:hypothetical protein
MRHLAVLAVALGLAGAACSAGNAPVSTGETLPRGEDPTTTEPTTTEGGDPDRAICDEVGEIVQLMLAPDVDAAARRASEIDSVVRSEVDPEIAKRASGVADAGNYYLGNVGEFTRAIVEAFDDPYQAMLVLLTDADNYCIQQGLT